MKICKFILGFLSRNLFEVQLSWLPIICGKKYKQFMSVLLKNHNFITRFSVSVLSFFNRNSCFTLIYIKIFGISVISTGKLSTLLICGKQSLKLLLDPLKICEFTTRFSEQYKYYREILWSLVIYVQKFTQFVLGFLKHCSFTLGFSVY